MQVTIIGGGSYQWSPKLIATSSAFRRWPGSTSSSRTSTRAPLDKMEAIARIADDKLGRQVDGVDHHRPAPRPRRCRLRGRDDLHRWLHQHGRRHRRARPPRHPPVGRRQRRPRRDQPGPAQHPRARRHRPRHGGPVPRGVVAQHHEPDDHAHAHGVSRDAYQDRRPVPRGRRLLHGPRHRLPQAPYRRAAGDHGDQPLSRSSPRSTSTARTASSCWPSWSTSSAASTHSSRHRAKKRQSRSRSSTSLGATCSS